MQLTHLYSYTIGVIDAPPKPSEALSAHRTSTECYVISYTRGKNVQVICPSNLLERSVASSDKLLWKHAPFYFLAADVATIAYGLSLRLFFLEMGYSGVYVGENIDRIGYYCSNCIAVFSFGDDAYHGWPLGNTRRLRLHVRPSAGWSHVSIVGHV